MTNIVTSLKDDDDYFTFRGRKYDKEFHRLLKAKFPIDIDMKERKFVEEDRLKVYNSALKKIRYIKGSVLKNEIDKFLTNDEKDAIDYVNGKGIYESYQDPSKYPTPNPLDSRKSFLLKLDDPDVRDRFMELYGPNN